MPEGLSVDVVDAQGTAPADHWTDTVDARVADVLEPDHEAMDELGRRLLAEQVGP